MAWTVWRNVKNRMCEFAGEGLGKCEMSQRFACRIGRHLFAFRDVQDIGPPFIRCSVDSRSIRLDPLFATEQSSIRCNLLLMMPFILQLIPSYLIVSGYDVPEN